MMLTAAHFDSMTTPQNGKLFQHREDSINIYIYSLNIYIYIPQFCVLFQDHIHPQGVLIWMFPKIMNLSKQFYVWIFGR